jgi:hypothetical protein
VGGGEESAAWPGTRGLKPSFLASFMSPLKGRPTRHSENERNRVERQALRIWAVL